MSYMLFPLVSADDELNSLCFDSNHTTLLTKKALDFGQFRSQYKVEASKSELTDGRDCKILIASFSRERH